MKAKKIFKNKLYEQFFLFHFQYPTSDPSALRTPGRANETWYSLPDGFRVKIFLDINLKRAEILNCISLFNRKST